MKTSGQDANPKPGKECVICGKELEPEEYELCEECERDFGPGTRDSDRLRHPASKDDRPYPERQRRDLW